MTSQTKFVLTLVGGAVVVIAFLLAVITSVGTVAAGERGVKTHYGQVLGIVPPGLFIRAPFGIEDVIKMDVRTQSFSASQEAPLMAASSDLQDTRLAVVVNYHIDPNQVVDIYQQYGTADRYYEQVVNPLITATIKSIASQYSAAEQIQKREEMSIRVQDALVKAFEGKNVFIEKTDITNIQFSAAFEKSIEEKVTAAQNALTAQKKVEQATFEAEAIRIKSEAANNEKYIQLQQLEVQKEAILKWDGKGCTSGCYGTGMQAPVQFLNVK